MCMKALRGALTKQDIKMHLSEQAATWSHIHVSSVTYVGQVACRDRGGGEGGHKEQDNRRVRKRGGVVKRDEREDTSL